MSDHRKVINPLLNVSVTGATLEDFSQHAVLLPAAEAPPVLQPVQLQPPPTLQPTSGTCNCVIIIKIKLG